MTDFNFNAEIVTLGGVDSTGGFIADTMELTFVAGMKQGSLVKADGTLAAKADHADVVGAIDDLVLRRHAETLKDGDKFAATVVKRGAILNESALSYTDGAIDANGKAALEKALNKFATVADDANII